MEFHRAEQLESKTHFFFFRIVELVDRKGAEIKVVVLHVSLTAFDFLWSLTFNVDRVS